MRDMLSSVFSSNSFLLFADDAQIFEPNQMLKWIQTKTRDDGSDLGPMLQQLFETLDTPYEQRQSNIAADMLRFPYVNGALFSENVRTVSFDSTTRNDLIRAFQFGWRHVSPAIFGSIFQGAVGTVRERREDGVHYTTEDNILKVIGPLFLDDLNGSSSSVALPSLGEVEFELLSVSKRFVATHVFRPSLRLR